MENQAFTEALNDIIKVQTIAKEKIKNGDIKEGKKYLLLAKNMLETLGRFGPTSEQRLVA